MTHQIKAEKPSLQDTQHWRFSAPFQTNWWTWGYLVQYFILNTSLKPHKMFINYIFKQFFMTFTCNLKIDLIIFQPHCIKCDLISKCIHSLYTRMHCCRIRTVRSLTVSHSICQGGVCMPRMPPCYAHMPPPHMHAPRHTCTSLPCTHAPPPVDRQIPVKT